MIFSKRLLLSTAVASTSDFYNIAFDCAQHGQIVCQPGTICETALGWPGYTCNSAIASAGPNMSVHVQPQILVDPAPAPIHVDPAPVQILVDPHPGPMIVQDLSLPIIVASNVGVNHGVRPQVASGDVGAHLAANNLDCPPCWEAGAAGKCVAKKGADTCFKLNCEYGNMDLDFSSDLFGISDFESPYPFTQTALGLGFSNGRWRSSCALGGCGMECESRTINGDEFLIFGMQVSVDRQQPITIENLGVFMQNPIRASIRFECAYRQKVTLNSADNIRGGNGGTCDANKKCETGVCKNGWCITGPCDETGNCDPGVCVAQPFFTEPGMCVDGGNPGQECVNDQCQSGVCQDGFCVEGGGPGEECVGGQCAAGLLCNDDGYCVDPTDNGGKCDNDDDCDKGVCLKGWCVTTPCGGGEGECDDGVCVALPWFALPGMCVDGGEPGQKCVNGECESGICLNGYCVGGGGPGEECVDGKCAAGLTCVDGYCRVVPDNGGKCSTNADCDAGAVCDKGWCVTTPCGADGECDEGVCVALPWFALPGMCVDGGNPGEKCVNGECVGGFCLNGVCVEGVGGPGQKCGPDGKCATGFTCNANNRCVEEGGWTVIRHPDYFGSSVGFGNMEPGFTMRVFVDAAMTIPVGMTNLFVGAPIYTQITWTVPVVTNVAGFFVSSAYVTLPTGQRITLITDNCYSNTFGVVQLQANKLVTASAGFKFTSFVVGARQESMQFKLTTEIMLCSLSETKCNNLLKSNDSQCPNTAGYNYRALTFGM